MALPYNASAGPRDSDPAPARDSETLFAAVAARYAGCGPAARSYVTAKLRRDPVHRAVLALATAEAFGDVVDLGCGRGQLGIALLASGTARSVRGLDVGTERLAQAARAGTGLAFAAECRDLSCPSALPAADTVLIVDVLYQLETEAQMALLQAAARAARTRVLVRTLDPDRGWRSALTLGLERVLRRISPHSGAQVNPLPVARLAGVLHAEGFAMESVPCWEGTPFANVLLMARRVPARR
jgi:SAM-dependent methyltransferase